MRAPGPQKAGFGFTHDGVIDTLTAFLGLQQFNTWPSQTKDDIVTFLMSFDTGTAPTVGYQATMTVANANGASYVDGWMHDVSGWFVFAFALAAVFGCEALLGRRLGRQPVQEQAP